MRDEQVGQATLCPEIQHQAQQLGSDRDIEHAHRLVRDHELWPHHQRTGDDHALALATRQLVRISEREVRLQSGRLERRHHLRFAIGRAWRQPVDLERLGHEVVDGLTRVEGLVGILEDELDAPSVVLQCTDAPIARHVGPGEGDLAAGLRCELDDDAPDGRLARARLAHEPEDLALLDREVDPIHRSHDTRRTAGERIHDPAPDRKVDLETLEADQLRHAGTAGGGVRRAATSSALIRTPPPLPAG